MGLSFRKRFQLHHRKPVVIASGEFSVEDFRTPDKIGEKILTLLKKNGAEQAGEVLIQIAEDTPWPVQRSRFLASVASACRALLQEVPSKKCTVACSDKAIFLPEDTDHLFSKPFPFEARAKHASLGAKASAIALDGVWSDRMGAADVVDDEAANVTTPILAESMVYGSMPDRGKSWQERLRELQKTKTESFAQFLRTLMDRHGLTDPDVYNRAFMNRQTFNKIINGYSVPKKNTLLLLAVVMELNLDEGIDLLARAGYALSPSKMEDQIVRIFLESGHYDLYDLDATLLEYGLAPLISA